MQDLSPLRNLTPHQYTLLIEHAKRDAARLRSEAITAFWAAAARRLRGALSTLTQRAARKEAAACPR